MPSLRLSLILIFAFLCLSCAPQDEAFEQFISPTTEDRVLAISYLCPDVEEQQIFVGLTSKVGDSIKISKYPSGAQIFIRDLNRPDSFLITRHLLPFLLVVNQKEFPIERGRTYRISIKYKGKIIYGQTKVPSKNAFFSNVQTSQIEYLNTKSNGDKWYQLYLQLNWKNVDITGKNGYLFSYGSFFSNKFEEKDYQCFLSPPPNVVFLSVDNKIKINLSLLTTDENLKRFLKAKEKYNYLATDFSLLEQFSGVYPEFSNIQNGVGVVGSYIIHKEIYSVDVKK